MGGICARSVSALGPICLLHPDRSAGSRIDAVYTLQLLDSDHHVLTVIDHEKVLPASFMPP